MFWSTAAPVARSKPPARLGFVLTPNSRVCDRKDPLTESQGRGAHDPHPDLRLRFSRPYRTARDARRRRTSRTARTARVRRVDQDLTQSNASTIDEAMELVNFGTRSRCERMRTPVFAKGRAGSAGSARCQCRMPVRCCFGFSPPSRTNTGAPLVCVVSKIQGHAMLCSLTFGIK